MTSETQRAALERALSARVPFRAARGTVKSIYEQILDFFPADEPPVMFGVLAATPSLLELYWDSIRPAIDSSRFVESVEMVTDTGFAQIRGTELLQGQAVAQNIGLPTVAEYLANSPIFVTPLQAVLSHAIGAGVDNPKQALVKTALPPTSRARLVSEADASPRVSKIYSRIKKAYGFPVFVPRYYEGVAVWPDLLEYGWNIWEPFVGTTRFDSGVAAVSDVAATAAEGFPGQIPSISAAAANAGVDERTAADVQTLFESFATQVAPEIILSSCFFVEFLRSRQASRSH